MVKKKEDCSYTCPVLRALLTPWMNDVALDHLKTLLSRIKIGRIQRWPFGWMQSDHSGGIWKNGVDWPFPWLVWLGIYPIGPSIGSSSGLDGNFFGDLQIIHSIKEMRVMEWILTTTIPNAGIAKITEIAIVQNQLLQCGFLQRLESPRVWWHHYLLHYYQI